MGGPVLNTTLPMKERLTAVLRSAWFYGRWYPGLGLPAISGTSDVLPEFARDARKVRKLSRKLARRLFHSMLRHGPKLEKKQVLLGRYVEIGAELFAMSSAMGYATHLIGTGKADRTDLTETVRYFCRRSRGVIENLFHDLRSNADGEGYQLAKKMIS
jgi:hypothetical protein